MSAPATTPLRHAVCWYDDDPDLQAGVATATLDTLSAGGTVAVGLRPATEVALRRRIAGECGADAVAGLVRLQRQWGPDGPSGQTDAVNAARVLRTQHEHRPGPLTVVAEQVAGFDAPYWREVEAAVQVALSDLPVLLVCFFPRVLPAAVASMVHRAHPLELSGDGLHGVAGHSDPRHLLAEQPAPVPAELGPPQLDLTFDAARLREVRAAVDRVLRGQGFGARRTEDVTVAVNEVATNAVHHGDGPARLLVWTPGGDVVCEVHDAGTLGDPLPGLAPPEPGAEHGRGIWIARQLCDLLHVWADDHGTHVRIRAAA